MQYFKDRLVVFEDKYRLSREEVKRILIGFWSEDKELQDISTLRVKKIDINKIK